MFEKEIINLYKKGYTADSLINKFNISGDDIGKICQNVYQNIHKRYYEKLRIITHYQKHPQMRPFVGKKYGVKKKLLIIAESHFLDDDTTKKSTIKNWYNLTNKELKEDQISWTNTAKVIDHNIWANRYTDAHIIYKFIRNAISESCFNKLSDNQLLYISYMNFFQRPAEKTGESIIYTEKDIEIANNTLKKVLKIINAEYIFFISSKAWDNFDKHLFDPRKTGHSCHPTCKWWNMETKKYTKPNSKEKITGKNSFIYFLRYNKIFN